MKDDNWFIDDGLGFTAHGEWSASEGFSVRKKSGCIDGWDEGFKI